jgi:hypothetical protein
MNTIRDRLGQHGADLVSNTVAQTVASGNAWFAIQGMWSITIIATLTEIGTASAAGSYASTALFANNVIYGAFTNFTLTSGAVRAYRAKATSG